MGLVINFPLTHSRNAPLYREPLRQALTPRGMPVRSGDSVIITDTAGRKFAGTVEKTAPHDRCETFQLYQVRCHDGHNRVVTADQIEALA